MPDTDKVISVTSEEVLTIIRPSKRNNLRLLGRGGSKAKVGLKLVNEGALLKVEDLDGRGGGSTEPVSVRREGKAVDFVVAEEGVKVLRAVQVPKDDRTILTTGSTEGSIRGDGDGGNVTVVANVVGEELGVLDVPDLYTQNELAT